jgi:hypothetical protein
MNFTFVPAVGTETLAVVGIPGEATAAVAVEAGGGVTVARWGRFDFLYSDLLFPQLHIVKFLFVSNIFSGRLFKQTGGSGYRKPAQNLLQPIPTEPQSKWKCGPDTKAVKAIKQMSKNTITCFLPQ